MTMDEQSKRPQTLPMPLLLPTPADNPPDVMDAKTSTSTQTDVESSLGEFRSTAAIISTADERFCEANRQLVSTVVNRVCADCALLLLSAYQRLTDGSRVNADAIDHLVPHDTLSSTTPNAHCCGHTTTSAAFIAQVCRVLPSAFMRKVNGLIDIACAERFTAPDTDVVTATRDFKTDHLTHGAAGRNKISDKAKSDICSNMRGGNIMQHENGALSMENTDACMIETQIFNTATVLRDAFVHAKIAGVSSKEEQQPLSFIYRQSILSDNNAAKLPLPTAANSDCAISGVFGGNVNNVRADICSQPLQTRGRHSGQHHLHESNPDPPRRRSSTWSAMKAAVTNAIHRPHRYHCRQRTQF